MRNPYKLLMNRARSAAYPGQVKKNGIKRTHALEVSIDHEWVEEQFKRQDCRCYWTNMIMDMDNVFMPGYPFSPSLERLDSDKGYTKDNVVLCLSLFNLGRRRWPEDKYKLLLNQLQNHYSQSAHA